MDKLLELLGECKKFEAKYYYNMDNYFEGNVFHYTSAVALEGILRNKKLWITKSDFLNDKTEYLYGINLSKKILSNNNYKYIDENMFNRVKKVFDSSLNRSFIFSTSKNKDSVNLWGNYSHNDGYNIQFSLDEIFNDYWNGKIYVLSNSGVLHYAPKKGGKDSVSISCEEVIYDYKKQKEIITNTFCFMDNMLENYYTNIEEIENGPKHANIVNEIFEIGFNILFKNIRLFKNEVFAQDEECRIIFEVNDNLDVIKYRQFNGAFIPYIEVGFKNENNSKDLPIRALTIGPKNNLDIAQRGLKLFIESLNYKVAENLEILKEDEIYIKKSDVPLRY